MHVLVTGGSGFIGRSITDLCLSKGWNVTTFDIKKRAIKGVTSNKGDIKNIEEISNSMKNIDIVFHEAAVTSPPEFETNGVASFNTNVIGTLNVLQSAAELGVKKVILASSSSIYGNLTEPGREDMDIPVHGNLYPLSKLVNEKVSSYFSKKGDLQTVCLRYFNTYGIGENSKGAYSSVISKFIEDINANKTPVIFGNGKQRRDFVFVEDVAKANILAIEHGTSGDIYNVGTGISTTFNELLEIVKDEMGSKIEAVYEPIPYKSYQLYTQADMAKTRRKLGYTPSYDIRKGVRKILDSMSN